LHKRLIPTLALALLLVFNVVTVSGTSFAAGRAVGAERPVRPAAPGGLIIYSGRTTQQIIDVRILDAIVGQFRHNYKLISDTDFGHENLADYQYVIYMGAEEKTLPAALVTAVDNYTGPFYAFYANANQFTRKLPWLRMDGRVLVNKVGLPDGSTQDLSDELATMGRPSGTTTDLSGDHLFYDVSGQGASVTVIGQRSGGGGSVPLGLHVGDDYYFAGVNMHPPVDGYVSETLLDFFHQKGVGFVKYLRLEDVHPLSDPRLLMEQARWLKQEGIPYMVTVIPVYQYADGDKVHLYQKPAVVRALRYMQANGGSIVLHGYTHKFRAEETGEGFEFWDAENDRPIYQPADAKPKFRSDFATEAEWNAFVKEGEKFEVSYIEERLTLGVQELVAHGLYPIAFEPPHYAISQLGYKIVAQHFSSYIGQLQMSDSTWKSGYAPPYASQPTFIHGMTVYPETLGFIEEDRQEASFQSIRAELESRTQFSQGYLAAFYHPYLGLAGLERLVGLMNEFPGKWLNLKDESNFVQVKNIRITTEDGIIHVEQPSFPRFASAYARNLWIRNHLPFAVPIILVLLTAAGYLVIRREIRQRA
jgi:uncharacterized protein YdaL